MPTPNAAPTLLLAAVWGAGGCTMLFEPEDCPGRDARAVAALNTSAREDDPSLSEDGLELLFDRNPEPNIFLATRESVCDVWSDPQPLWNPEPFLNASNPTFGADGNTVYVSARSGGDDLHDIFYATRSERGSPFGEPKLLGEVNTENTEWEVAEWRDGEIFLTREDDILHGPLDGDLQVLDLIPGQLARSPWVSSDGLEIYFHARPSNGSDLRIYETRRESLSAPFGSVKEVELEDPHAEDPFVFGSRIYYAAPGAQGDDDLVVAPLP